MHCGLRFGAAGAAPGWRLARAVCPGQQLATAIFFFRCRQVCSRLTVMGVFARYALYSIAQAGVGLGWVGLQLY